MSNAEIDGLLLGLLAPLLYLLLQGPTDSQPFETEYGRVNVFPIVPTMQ